MKFNPISLKNLDQTTHGMYGTRTYKSWQAMISRVKTKRWYSERGIAVCERWTKFENFYADMGERPANTTLDRINNDGHYEPGNCRWANTSEQQSNKRSNVVLEFNGQRQCAKHWAQQIGVGVATIHWRIKHGWPVEKILSAKLFHEQKGKRKAA